MEIGNCNECKFDKTVCKICRYEPLSSHAVLAEVSSVDEARSYLLALCRYKFKDKTFESYILNRLAGDFAVEIANVFIRERNARNLR